MSVDPRDRALGQVLDDAVRGIDPDLEFRLPWIRRSGSARRALRWTAIVASLGVFVGGIGWTALALREVSRPTPAAQVEIPYADAVLELPPGWSGTSAAGLRVAALFASTSNEALSGLIRGCRAEDDDCGIRRIDVERLGPHDGFVEVWATSVPLAPDRLPPLLPPVIGPDVFLDGPLHLGQPVRTLTGRGTTRGTYEVRYWIGPQGGEEVRSSVAGILARLDLPTPIAPFAPVTDGWNTYRDSEVGLSVRYPLAWHLQPFS